MTHTTDPFEVPEQVRAFAEKGIAQARDNYAKFKEVAEGGNGAIEAAFGAASKGVHAYSAKLLGFGQANTNAGFDFLQELVGAKSLSDATEVWSSHARRQFGVFADQTRELTQLAQEIATETAEPIKTGAAKLFQPVA
jgi:phasin